MNDSFAPSFLISKEALFSEPVDLIVTLALSELLISRLSVGVLVPIPTFPDESTTT